MQGFWRMIRAGALAFLLKIANRKGGCAIIKENVPVHREIKFNCFITNKEYSFAIWAVIATMCIQKYN